MIRQSLDAGSSYAAVAGHGSGMTALQFRRARGANTEDIELNIEAPGRFGLKNAAMPSICCSQ